MLAFNGMIQLTPGALAVLDIATAALISFTISMALTPIYTTLAFRYRAWKRVRQTDMTGSGVPIFYKLHAAKHRRNIPTMAGIIMVIAISLVTASFNLSRSQTYLPLFGTLAAGTVGLIDDLINIRGAALGIAGLRTRVKLLLILSVATAAGLYSYHKLGYTSLALPFFGQINFGWWLVPFIIFVIVATANAVNITDGLDGLAGGLLAIAFSAYAMIAFFQDNYGIAAFCATVVGTLLAYTWFNIYPARFFMGDVGSFALGTALAIVALLTDTLLVLPVIAGIFVIEAGSSAIQIVSKKFFKRKVFLSAPVHHHLEAIGWPETKVTMRFWVLGAVFAVMGIMLALVGGQT